ncbi:MAG: hypothetical protein U0570_06685 [Phycisphaerales bacterium]
MGILSRSFGTVVLLGSATATTALAAIPAPWYQGFESDTSGWFDGSGYGSITRQTGPLTAYQGNAYAVVSGTQNGSAPYTRWGAYSTTFPAGGYNTSIAVYLDPNAINVGQGFDLSSAANSVSNTHVRDFIFHFGKMADGSVRVGASNNSSFSTRMDLDANNSFQILTAGWYVLQHQFRDNGSGVLSVNLNLLDAGLSTLWSKTLSDASDGIGAPVGGNRYGWFTFADGNYAVDAAQLDVVPSPGTLALTAAAGLVALRRRR